MSQKRRNIWRHFNWLKSDDNRAECRVCKLKLSVRGGSTNSLHRHMRTLHPTVQLEEMREAGVPVTTSHISLNLAATTVFTSQPSGSGRQPTTTQTTISQFMAHKMTPLKQNKIPVDEDLAIMIACDFQPFSIVEDRGIRDYSHSLNPQYVIPSRKTISEKIIPRLYEREQTALQERVNQASSVCLSTDCCTSRTTTSFKSVTCHFMEDFKMVSCLLDCFELNDRHTSENLAEALQKIANQQQSSVLCQ